MPSAGDSTVPSVSVIFCVALNVLKQNHGLPRRQLRHVPHTARQLRMTKSPGATLVTPVADRLDDARGLVAEQEREVVVDPTLAVVQVGVAHTARLDLDDGLARARDPGRRSSRSTPARPSSAPRLREPAVPSQPPYQRPAGLTRAEITRRARPRRRSRSGAFADGAELTSGPTASMMSSMRWLGDQFVERPAHRRKVHGRRAAAAADDPCAGLDGQLRVLAP